MTAWLNEDLKKRVRAVFEPRYKRQLTDAEVEEIALNLTDLTEQYLRFRSKGEYGEKIPLCQ